MPKIKDTIIHFRITKALKQRIKEEANKEGITITEWIIRLIRHKLKMD